MIGRSSTLLQESDARSHAHAAIVFISEKDDLERLMGDIDAIIADTADLIALHRLDLETVRDVLAQDMYGGGASVPQAAVASGSASALKLPG
jgi:hypothetical protein